MEKIKKQVSAIIVYNGVTFQELDQEYKDLGARIEEGVERMKAARVFANHEIEEIRKYALDVRNDKYNTAYVDIRELIRNNFEF